MADIDKYLPNLVVNLGILTDPGYVGPWAKVDGAYVPPGYQAGVPLDEQHLGDYGGLNSLLVWPDLMHMIGIDLPA